MKQSVKLGHLEDYFRPKEIETINRHLFHTTHKVDLIVKERFEQEVAGGAMSEIEKVKERSEDVVELCLSKDVYMRHSGRCVSHLLGLVFDICVLFHQIDILT